MTAGSLTDEIFFVASGLLRAVVNGDDGSEVTTDFIKNGDFFLAGPVSVKKNRAAITLAAALPSSVFTISNAAIFNFCLKYEDIPWSLLAWSLRRESQLREQLRRNIFASAEDLVFTALCELTNLAPAGDGRYDKRITQAVIASYVGLSREQVNKTMRDLESRGLVQRGRSGIYVSPELAAAARLDEPLQTGITQSAKANKLNEIGPHFYSSL